MMNQLTQEQMKKMYGGKGAKSVVRKKPKEKPARIQETIDFILVEMDGQKRQLPTWKAFNRLVKENQSMKMELERALMELRTIKHQMRALHNNQLTLENDLKGKVDLP